MELKIKPTLKHINTLFAQGNTVRLHSGVRAGESDKRSKMLEREFDGNMLCEVFRPLLKWTIEDVWAMHRKYGIPRNGLYDHGAKRVGCLPCVMSRKSEIRLIADRFPETIDTIRGAESAPEFAHKGGSSFFQANAVPPQFRSRSYTRKKDGRVFKVCGIDDVVRWSKTEDGAKQIMAGRDPLQPTFDFISRAMDDPSTDDSGRCDSNIGFCE